MTAAESNKTVKNIGNVLTSKTETGEGAGCNSSDRSSLDSTKLMTNMENKRGK